jgi:nitroreductase
MPLEPLDAKGLPDKWTPIEKEVFNRRSVRNFTDKPVPEHIIRRVLEAGRFAPSAGNSQPWKFIVVTNKALLKEIDETVVNIVNELFNTYIDDESVKDLAAGYEANPNPGYWDPRLMFGGLEKHVMRLKTILLGAPALILIAGDSRAISGPELQVGICGQNMILVAHSLGIRATWIGFVVILNRIPAFLEKLGVKDPFRIVNSVVLGYPKFNQDGIVPREFRPITWFREGIDAPEIEE